MAKFNPAELSVEELQEKKKAFKKKLYIIYSIFGAIILITLLYNIFWNPDVESTDYVPIIAAAMGMTSTLSISANIKKIDEELEKRGVDSTS